MDDVRGTTEVGLDIVFCFLSMYIFMKMFVKAPTTLVTLPISNNVLITYLVLVYGLF